MFQKRGLPVVFDRVVDFERFWNVDCGFFTSFRNRRAKTEQNVRCVRAVRTTIDTSIEQQMINYYFCIQTVAA